MLKAIIMLFAREHVRAASMLVVKEVVIFICAIKVKKNSLAYSLRTPNFLLVLV